jgi:hypothetical protein
MFAAKDKVMIVCSISVKYHPIDRVQVTTRGCSFYVLVANSFCLIPILAPAGSRRDAGSLQSFDTIGERRAAALEGGAWLRFVRRGKEMLNGPRAIASNIL